MKSAGERELAVPPPTRWILLAATLIALVVGTLVVVKYPTEVRGLVSRLVGRFRGPALPAGFALGNGRIEATEYDIASKRPGRIASVAVREGDMVEAGQVLARIDTRDLEADLHEAEAQSAQAREDRRRALAAITQRESEVQSALAGITQRQSDRRRAEAAVAQRRSGVEKSQAAVAQRESELALARKELQRSQSLFDSNLRRRGHRRDSMPEALQMIMLAAPTTHFVRFAQAILYRGAGLDVVWRDFVAITALGVVFFSIALARFRGAVARAQS